MHLDNGAVSFQPPIELRTLDEFLSYEYIEGYLNRKQVREIALYIHIPFCGKKCTFCDFLVISGNAVTKNVVQKYLTSLKKELEFYANLLQITGIIVRSIQVGGGTPSLLSARQIDELLSDLLNAFDSKDLNEIIYECFPSSLSPDKLYILAGDTRVKINMGIQAFDDQQLQHVGRPHDSETAISAIKLAKRFPRLSIGVDLICGLPGSTSQSTSDDIDIAADLGIDHIALYPLWLYETTPLYHQVKNGILDVPQFSERYGRIESCLERLEQRGFRPYTIYHYAKPFHEHHYGLWQMSELPWLGMGLGAISSLEGLLLANTANLTRYFANTEGGVSAISKARILNCHERMLRFFLFGLRKKRFTLDEFEVRFNLTFEQVFALELDFLKSSGYLESDGESMSLTLQGWLLLHKIEHQLIKLAETNSFFGANTSGFTNQYH